MRAPFLRAGQSPQAAIQALLGGAGLAQLGRYVLISGLAFGLDLSVFLLLLPLGTSPVLASVAGYLGGTQLHWLLSTRLVFAAGVRQDRAARRRQQVLFFASAAVGVTCNAGIVAASQAFMVPLLIGKLAAIGTSFVLVLAVRATIIFANKQA
jgi:putative flippase GtrA